MGSDVGRQVGGPLYTDRDADAAAESAVAIAGPPTLRVEFGSHLEANDPRLVAQLSMSTLDVGQFYKLADGAYGRAWQRWSVVRESADPTAWIRQIAVRASARGRPKPRFRRTKPAGVDGVFEQPMNQTAFWALGQLKPYIRRPLVLADVAHLSIEEVARVEGIVVVLAESRLTRGAKNLPPHSALIQTPESASASLGSRM